MSENNEFDISIDADVEETTDSTSAGSGSMYANADKAHAEGRQTYSKRGDSADEIDPRKLVRNPELSELRWYYRRTFAKKLVNKPIDDAFKHGFGFDGEEEERSTELIESANYVESYTLAEKKARRDGFSLVFLGTRESWDGRSGGVHMSPKHDDVSVEEITHTKVLTIDDLCHCADKEIMEDVEEAWGLQKGEFEIRRTGIVINKDITSPEFRDPIGYVLYQGSNKRGESIVQFIHRDRVQHLVWNEEVDGDYHEDSGFGVSRWRYESPLGRWEGDSVLVQSYDLMKGLTKGNWAIMQALFRNASNLYAVHMPNDATQEEFNKAKREFSNLNAKSELFLPGGPPGESEDTYEVKQYTSGDMVEPAEYFDVIFDQLCATHEMTKSVLFGTQTGTVSGSETDIKNYFNKVERYRQTRASKWIMDFLDRSKFMLDDRVRDENKHMNVDIVWEPLFKVSEMERVNTMQSLISTLNVAVNGFVLTPDEARNILAEEWADVDVNDLDDEQMALLAAINQVGLPGQEDDTERPREGRQEEEEANGPDTNEGEEVEEEEVRNPSMRQGGGMPAGHKTGEMANRGE